ncbi:hypothetical protein DOE51_00735 [Bdellovibrio sp. NC01]|nr:hypothetical protein DOE51_00735 [Bdellovibrio sp. NC01]
MLLFASCKSTETPTQHSYLPTISLNNSETKMVAEQVYAYGYPLLIMDVSKDMMTATPVATDSKAPINQFAHKREFPDASFTDIVSPNADTLYSTAWLDLSKEPIVLSVPDTGKRYYIMQLMNAWTEVFANPGTRTTGNGKGNFVITGPNWSGSVPEGLRQIKSATNDVMIIGRTEATGKSDFAAVNEIQDGYRLTPLSSWGRSYSPPRNVAVKPGVNLTQTPVDQVEGMSGIEFFTKLSESMKRNPPLAQDKIMIEKMRSLGIEIGKTFDPSVLSLDQRNAINAGAQTALNKIINAAKNPKGEKANGWTYHFNTGRYGTNYANRAVIAHVGLGANLPQDAVYPVLTTDSMGRRLNGKYSYVLHFPKGELPPVNAFWSITLYNDKNYFVRNPLNKYSVGNHDKLVFNRDGSLDIYIQYQPPAKSRIPNWLPTPQGNFKLMARLYWPKYEILNRNWRLPAIQRVETPLKQLSQNDTFE